MKKTLAFILAACMMLGAFSGCGTEKTDDNSSQQSSNAVAGENEKAPEVELDTDNLTPVYGDAIADGVYEIDVDSSSSMFKITQCQLTVSGDEMTAVMTMSGTGYLYLFMGKGADADENAYIPFVENENGEHTFTVPVEALDQAVDCAAFSKKKEKWYDRTLVFRSDSLPDEAFTERETVTAESLGLADGAYTVDVTLSGGSGRASVDSPAKLTVENGTAYAEIIWSSSNYDYMIVDGEKIMPESTEGNSTFIIPVLYFNRDMPVLADTTAMSTPYEIEYTLYFDAESIAS